MGNGTGLGYKITCTIGRSFLYGNGRLLPHCSIRFAKLISKEYKYNNNGY